MKNNNYKGSKKAVFKEAQCDRSPFCPVVKSCPTEAITKKKLGFMSIQVLYDSAKCIGCGNCVKACPHSAFAVR